MEVYLLDNSFNTVGIIDNCITLEAAKRFFSPGEFRMTLKGKAHLSSAYALYEPVSKSCFIIEGYEEEGGKTTLSGRSLEALLEKRILDGRGRYSGNAEKAVRLAVEKSTSGERSLSGMILGDVSGLEGEGYFESDYRNLSEFAYSTLRTFGAAYRVELSGNTPVFIVVTGKDRSRNQTQNTPAVFSESMGNVTDGRVKIDISEHKNTAYVLGADGRSVTVVTEASPFDRRELFVSGRDLYPEDFATEDEYFEALKSRGLETLSRYGGAVTYSGCASGGLRFGVDYDLGDICEIDTSSGMTLTERITEVKYTFHGRDTLTVTPLFGGFSVSLDEYIRDSVRQV